MAVSLDWLETIKNRFADKIVGVRESAPGEPEITVAAEHAHELMAALKVLEGGPFEHLADIASYDEHPRVPRFHVVYELISMTRKQRCAVVAPLHPGAGKPAIRTISDLWKGADWLEREVWDLMGIEFTGHPDMRRILLPQQFVGHPLHKDFVLDYRQQFPESEPDEGIFDPFGNTIIEKVDE